jgi:hypothetical protein
MAESSARTGLAVVCTSGGSDANAVKFARREFEAYLNCWVDRAIIQVIYCIQIQLNFEKLIFQTFQARAVGKTLKPYQGLKHSVLYA